jgi:hypothetical protein
MNGRLLDIGEICGTIWKLWNNQRIWIDWNLQSFDGTQQDFSAVMDDS